MQHRMSTRECFTHTSSCRGAGGRRVGGERGRRGVGRGRETRGNGEGWGEREDVTGWRGDRGGDKKEGRGRREWQRGKVEEGWKGKGREGTGGRARQAGREGDRGYESREEGGGREAVVVLYAQSCKMFVHARGEDFAKKYIKIKTESTRLSRVCLGNVYYFVYVLRFCAWENDYYKVNYISCSDLLGLML